MLMASDYVKPQFDGRITLLKILASFVNPSDVAQISVTLNVNGVIITGTMIGMKPYYDAIAEKLIERLVALPVVDRVEVAGPG